MRHQATLRRPCCLTASGCLVCLHQGWLQQCLIKAESSNACLQPTPFCKRLSWTTACDRGTCGCQTSASLSSRHFVWEDLSLCI